MSNAWYPRYVGDYMRDTGHLSLAEHGAYNRLLDCYYANRKPLPADAPALHRLCSAMTDEERAAVTAVSNEFFPVNGDGMRHNHRADREIDRMQVHYERLSEAGRKGGLSPKKARLKRGLKPGRSISTSTSTSISKATTKKSPPSGGAGGVSSDVGTDESLNNPVSSVNANVSLPPDAQDKSTTVNDLPFESPAFAETWKAWSRHRKAIKKPMTDEAVALIFKRLAKHPAHTAIAMLERSIENGWQGIFDNDKRTGNTTPAKPDNRPSLAEIS